MEYDHPILLYDGTCGFCAESLQLVLRHDRRRTLRFAALVMKPVFAKANTEPGSRHLCRR